MKALVQRVSRGRVTVGDRDVGAIGRGLVVLLGVREGDSEEDARWLARKTGHLRIFADEQDRMNRSVQDVNGQILVIPQFTLYADTRKGHRPSFVRAAAPSVAETLYGAYVAALRALLGADRVEEGVFRATMSVALVNEGPVTIELSTDESPS